jgi:hypothetical protein
MASPRATVAAATLLLLALALSGCSGGSGGDDDPTPSAGGGGSSTASPKATAAPTSVVPAGWQTQTLEGLTVAYPPEFVVRDDAEDVTLQVGIPFTGQPFPPPQVQFFVETGQVGPLEVREPLTRAQINQQLGGIEIPPSTPASVAGATAAVEFTYEYRTAGGTSVLDTPLEPTDMRQTDLLVEVPGLPKYGVRYSAPADQYDPALWDQIVAALSVSADRTGA